MSLTKPSFVFILLLTLPGCGERHAHVQTASQSTAELASETRTPVTPTPSPIIRPTPELKVSFGDGLHIVPTFVNLKDPRLHYEIDVVYPQIEGSTSAPILKLNDRIKNIVTDQYK